MRGIASEFFVWIRDLVSVVIAAVTCTHILNPLFLITQVFAFESALRCHDETPS